MTEQFSLSRIRSYQACPRKYYLSYREGLSLVEEARPLRRGRALHKALEAVLRGQDWEFILYDIPDEVTRWQIAGIMQGYANHQPLGNIRVLETEMPWEWNGWRGIADAIVEVNGERCLLEHKTYSGNRDWHDTVWTDTQLALYQHALGIQRAIYQVISFSGRSPEQGETAEEFEYRKLDMKQPGRAKRKMPETEEEYTAKMSASVTVEIVNLYMDSDTIADRVAELEAWKKRCLADEEFPPNSGACVGRYGSKCPFFLLCQSRFAPQTLESYYERRVVEEVAND